MPKFAGTVITLPEDPMLRQRLEMKLKEYKSRIEPYRAPEAQPDVTTKTKILEALLRDGSVAFDDMLDLLHYHLEIDKCWVANAFGVIKHYAGDASCPVNGGTGLPQLASV